MELGALLIENSAPLTREPYVSQSERNATPMNSNRMPLTYMN